jgi:hypothetical protein
MAESMLILNTADALAVLMSAYLDDRKVFLKKAQLVSASDGEESFVTRNMFLWVSNKFMTFDSFFSVLKTNLFSFDSRENESQINIFVA